MKRSLKTSAAAVALCVVCAGMSRAETVKGKGEIVRKEGKHIVLELYEEHWKILKDPKAYLDFLDEVYEQYEELIGGVPNGGEKQRILEVDDWPGGWAVAGQPIRWHSRYVAESLRKVNEGDPLFGLLHELGHVFDIGAWNWHAEFFANFKMMYVIEELGSHGLNIREHEKYFRDIAVRRGAEDDKPLSDWHGHSDAATHKFLVLKNEIGWEPFKKTFREIQRLPEDKLPQGVTGTLGLFIHLLSKHSKKDLWKQFDDWGFSTLRPEPYDAALPAEAFVAVANQMAKIDRWVEILPIAPAARGGDVKVEVTYTDSGEYEYGLCTHANSRIVYDLGGRYASFDALASPFGGGGVLFQVKGDGKLLWGLATRNQYYRSRALQVDVSGMKVLELLIGDELDGRWDGADWAEARLTDKHGKLTYLDDLKPVSARQDIGTLETRHDRNGKKNPIWIRRFPKAELRIAARVKGKSFPIEPADAPGVYSGRTPGLPPGRHPLLIEIRHGGAILRKPSAATVDVHYAKNIQVRGKSVPPYEGCVLSLPLDAGEGLPEDVSENGDAVAQMSAAWTAQGRRGGGLRFAETNVVLAHGPRLNPTEAITVEAWMRLDSGGSPWHTLFSKYGAYRLHISQGKFHFSVGSATAATSLRDVKIQQDVWYHVVGTYDRQYLKIYVNGLPRGAAPYRDPIPITQSALALGYSLIGNAEPLIGTLDEVRIYNRALTLLEIEKSYFGR